MTSPDDDGQVLPEAATRTITQEFLAYWAAQDVTRTVALLHQDATSHVHLDEAGPMSGVVTGRDAIEAGLYGNLATWFYLAFEPTITAVEGETARIQVQFEYQHQRSGLLFAGSMRWSLVVRDGLVARVDCFHDSQRVQAFKRLLAAEGHAL